MPPVLPYEAIHNVADPTERLVQAGARLLVDDGLAVLSAGFSPDTVTTAAGRTRRVFYDHFDTKDDYCRQVLLPFLDIGDHRALSSLFHDAFTELVLEADGDLVQSVSEFSAVFFENANVSQEPLIRAIAFTMGHKDPELREALAKYNHDIDSVYATVIEEALVAWGRKMRAPWTPRLLSTVLRAMAESFFAYNAVEPGVINHELFASIVLTVIGPILAPLDEPDQRIEAALSGISRTSTATWRERNNPVAVTNTRKMVLDALEPCLQDHGILGLTLESIAERAGVSSQTLRGAFGSVDDIIHQAVTQSLPALQREVDFDLSTPGLQTPEILTRHFTRLIKWAGAHPWLVRAALALPHLKPGGSAGVDDGDALIKTLSGPAVVTLQAGIDSAELARALDAPRAGRMATTIVLEDALAPSAGPPSESAQWISRAILSGVSVASSPAQDNASAGE